MTDTLYVPALPPSVKHATVFSKFDALPSGASFVLVNDHDPVPLFYEMKAERGDAFEWRGIENGPEVWRVEIVKKRGDGSCEVLEPEASSSPGQDLRVLNVTVLEPRLKHPTIFAWFDALSAGEGFEIKNDHDPKPLYYQLLAERGAVFSWTYLEKGPQWWRVQIQKKAKEDTVGEIAATDWRKADLLKKLGVDFCCGGKKTLREACEEKGLNTANVEAELQATETAPATGLAHDYNRWQPDFLADYIYNQHHLFYYTEKPVLIELTAKVKERHGAHFPELEALATLVHELTTELDEHFLKEEQVVFPFIKALAQAKRTGNFEALKAQPSLTAPVQVMESEHEAAGELLAKMQSLTNGYAAPAGACNSFQFLYKKLKALDEDLHQHIHLENNLLFPKALQMEKDLRNQLPS